MQLDLKHPADKATISAEIEKFRSMIAERKSEIEVLAYAIAHYQKQCKHEGQVTGHNERDGAWGNPCPTCGYSY